MDSRTWAIFARAWLSLLRTVPTGTSQASAISWYEVIPLKCRSISTSRCCGGSSSTASQIQSRIACCSTTRSGCEGPSSRTYTCSSTSSPGSSRTARNRIRDAFRTIARSHAPTAAGSRTSPIRRSAVNAASCTASSASGPCPSRLNATARMGA